MRLYAPLYEGDSNQRPDAAVGEAVVRISNSPVSAASFVHGNIAHEAAIKAAPELQEMEIGERAARGAWIAGIMNSVRSALADLAARHDNADRVDFLAGATTLTEFVQRRHDFARSELSRYQFTDC